MNRTSEHLTLLVSEKQIADTVRRVAAEIRRDAKETTPVCVGILKGAFVFMADLLRALGEPVELDFARVSSYADSDSPVSEPVVEHDISLDIEGRDVLLIEDIVDTGRSLACLVEHLSARSPRSLKIAALVDKRTRRQFRVRLDYVGIIFEGGFLVGYGMDFAERYRNLPAIYELRPRHGDQ